MLPFGTACRAVAPPCLSTKTRSDRHFPDLAGACARGGRGKPKEGVCKVYNLCTTSLGTRLKPNVVPDWNIPNGNNSRRNNLVGSVMRQGVEYKAVGGVEAGDSRDFSLEAYPGGEDGGKSYRDYGGARAG